MCRASRTVLENPNEGTVLPIVCYRARETRRQRSRPLPHQRGLTLPSRLVRSRRSLTRPSRAVNRALSPVLERGASTRPGLSPPGNPAIRQSVQAGNATRGRRTTRVAFLGGGQAAGVGPSLTDQ
ncbi:hypothetical protein ACLI4Q_00810 [Natrialbaceae archaeon A-CW1-1]